MTPSELYNLTLRKIGVLGSGETAETSDTAIVSEAFKQLGREIEVSSAFIVDGTGVYLAEMLAADIGDQFRLDEQRMQRFVTKRDYNRKQILKILADDYDTDTVTEATYY